MERRFETGTVVSAIGHAGLILWVVVGDWLFAADKPPETVVMSVSTLTSAEFAELQAATATPAEEPAPVRPQARPEEVVQPEPEPEPEPQPEPEPVPEPEPAPEPEPVPEPEPEPEPVIEPPPSEAPQAEEEQALESESTEIQPLAEAEEIVAPDPVQPETEAETSDLPEPAVAEDPAAEEVIEQEPTQETVAEDTGDILQTEANQEQEAETGMTTSIRPRSRPERAPEAEPEPEVEVAAADVPEEPAPEEPAPEEQAVDDQATEDAIDALLGEAASEEPVEEPAETGGQDLPQGPPLTGGEMGDISSAIARRWNLGAASTDVLSTMVVIRVTFDQSGKPVDFELLESNGPSQAAVDNLFSIARRAVNRTHSEGGIPLPPDKFDTWRVLDLVFDANGMRLR
ncbi:MAG: cell envelope biogenesis protein TolA [Tabrizicola sp.]|jgi:hypothetical protein|nr:cell envelope biogenesis protein TolA [Tabrizicola sp.]